MTKFKIEKSKTADELVKLIEATLTGIDEEMEHGDDCENREKIIDRNVSLRKQLEKFIEDYKMTK